MKKSKNSIEAKKVKVNKKRSSKNVANSSKRRTMFISSLAVIIFGLIGGYQLFNARAASTAFASEEAESFSFGQNVWKVPDPAASSAYALKMTGNVAVEKQIELESKADSFTLSLKGQSCKGAPSATVYVDGVKIATTSIGNSTWSEINYAKTLPAGSHRFKVQFNNHFSQKRCERTLSFDKITFYAQPVVSSPTAPTPSPTTASQFSTSFNPGSSVTSGWQYQLSGATEKINIVNQRAECFAGGYSASTHYARVRRQLPEQDDFAAKKAFVIKADFDIPSNFYNQQESYMRFFNTDNFPGKYKSTGQTVGATSADEWRVGFLVYGGDKLPRLQSAHENHETITLWQGSRPLAVGRHTAEVRFTPSTTNTGSWELLIDGVKQGGQTAVKTVPVSVTAPEIAVTRVVGCIDGAADQDTKVINLNLYSLLFSADK